MPEKQQIEYSNIADIRYGHRDLQGRYKQQGATKEMLAEINEFIEEARIAGRLIGDEDERWTCQGYLDYWATTLYSHSEKVPSVVLEVFDEDSAPNLLDEDCPYVGLRAFDKKDATLFFGRENDSENLATILLDNRFAVVTGPSGAGKSSLIGAGLIPYLEKEHAIEGGWLVCGPYYPGAYPENTQKQAEVDINSSSGNSLLVVDQLEEIFTFCSEEEKTNNFIEWLINLSNQTEPRVFVVAALAEGFQEQFCMLAEAKQKREQENKELDIEQTGRFFMQSDYCEQHLYRIEPLELARLREVIIKPARLCNLQFESKVVDSLVDDLSAEPTVLPLLQFSLMELWNSRKGNRIKYEHYIGLGYGSLKGRGRAKKALAACAERLYKRMPSIAERVSFKNILLRLVKLREDGEIAPQRVREKKLMELAEKSMVDQVLRKIHEDIVGISPQSYTVITPRELNESELKKLSDKDMVRGILTKLSNAGLIRRFESTDEHDNQIEIAHEVLVRNWDTLRRWTRNRRVREELELERELKRAATTWAAHDKNPGLLWTDAIQIERQEKPEIIWRAEPAEREFLKESKLKARRMKWLKSVAYSAPFLLIAGLIWLILFQIQRNTNIEAGLSEILAPFGEKWGLQIEYESREKVLEQLHPVVRKEIELIDNVNSKNRSDFKPSIDAFSRFEIVAGKESDCAIVQLTRRQMYGNKQELVWSGFTTKFKFPGSSNRMYLSLYGNASDKNPQSIPITFTQYSLHESKNESGHKEELPVARYEIPFELNGSKYDGKMLHPILKDEHGAKIAIATMRLEQLTGKSKDHCD